jgi:hypothetical protein
MKEFEALKEQDFGSLDPETQVSIKEACLTIGMTLGTDPGCLFGKITAALRYLTPLQYPHPNA